MRAYVCGKWTVLVQEATAVMTLQSLKVLHRLLGSALAAVEKQFGPIVLAPGKEEELEKQKPMVQATKE